MNTTTLSPQEQMEPYPNQSTQQPCLECHYPDVVPRELFMERMGRMQNIIAHQEQLLMSQHRHIERTRELRMSSDHGSQNGAAQGRVSRVYQCITVAFAAIIFGLLLTFISAEGFSFEYGLYHTIFYVTAGVFMLWIVHIIHKTWIGSLRQGLFQSSMTKFCICVAIMVFISLLWISGMIGSIVDFENDEETVDIEQLKAEYASYAKYDSQSTGSTSSNANYSNIRRTSVREEEGGFTVLSGSIAFLTVVGIGFFLYYQDYVYEWMGAYYEEDDSPTTAPGYQQLEQMRRTAIFRYYLWMALKIIIGTAIIVLSLYLMADINVIWSKLISWGTNGVLYYCLFYFIWYLMHKKGPTYGDARGVMGASALICLACSVIIYFVQGMYSGFSLSRDDNLMKELWKVILYVLIPILGLSIVIAPTLSSQTMINWGLIGTIGVVVAAGIGLWYHPSYTCYYCYVSMALGFGYILFQCGQGLLLEYIKRHQARRNNGYSSPQRSSYNPYSEQNANPYSPDNRIHAS